MSLPPSLRLKQPNNYPSSLRLKEKPPMEEEEGFVKSSIRTVAQPAIGIAEVTPYGLLTNLISLLASGESLDPEEIEHIRMISEREGIPFDEEKYRAAVGEASASFPTPSNLARMTEEATGLPLEAKTKPQKLLRLAGSAGKLAPGGVAQKAAAAAVAPATEYGLEKLGVPEPIAELASLPISSAAAKRTPSIKSEAKVKPSGLKERGFEKLKEPRQVSESRMQKINSEISKDFKSNLERVMKESPVGKTAEELRKDPGFKRQTEQLFTEAKEIANEIPETVSSPKVKKALIKETMKPRKGFLEDEYDKIYSKMRNEWLKKIKGDVSYPELIEQYRKNNKSLSESFE